MEGRGVGTEPVLLSDLPQAAEKGEPQEEHSHAPS